MIKRYAARQGRLKSRDGLYIFGNGVTQGGLTMLQKITEYENLEFGSDASAFDLPCRFGHSLLALRQIRGIKCDSRFNHRQRGGITALSSS